MAAAMVGQAFLSASVQTLIDRITSSEFRDFLANRKLNVSLLDEMKTTLLMLNAVLNDAEEKQITDPAVKQWLDELKDVVLDAEDLLDKINTDSLRCKIEQDSADKNVVPNKVMSFLSSSFSQLYWGMNSKLEAITRRLNNFAKQKDILGLKSVSLKIHKTTTTSFVNESVVVGREDDKEKLLNMLLSEEDARQKMELEADHYVNELLSRSLIQVHEHYSEETLIMHDLINDLAKVVSGNLTHLRYLDISETGLKDMPMQISKMQNLQSLTCFFVGRHQDGLRVSELKKIPHLQGKLSVLNLQNVVDSMDAVKADLKSRQQIEELELEWGSDTQDSQLTRDVLDKLQPSTNLRGLNIKCNGGTSFPNWVGDSSLSYITYLCISDSNYCFSLPPFGQLLSLKSLSISGMKSMQTIGQEFYCSNVGSSSFHPFPSLEYLKFHDMPNWEEWLPIEGEGENLPFPRLRTLSLQCLPRMILRGNFLTGLGISDIPSLMCFPNNSLPTSLTSLQIENCEKLEFLPQEVWLNYTSLETLFILNSCHSLASFPLGCFPQLKSLFIRDCPNLEFFTQVEESALTLESFYISECKSLKSMSQVQSNSLLALTDLTLGSLPNLESLPQGGFPCNLRSITIGGDDIINKLLNQRLLPASLEDLTVHDLSYLKGLQYLTSLKELGIEDCSNLESLPEDELPSSLLALGILWCPKLEER
ncbi:putative disease resistance protein [Senna tora]|uniref:Putative disease resistance protein n=1 Tax=Senna tora TaxID=362788 RepID=A0A834T5F1_9FABA|nr:putative disease resistance protein [Senna tora]